MFHPRGPTFWELAQQCLSSTERGYDLLAPKFDFTPFRTPDEILAGLAKFLGPPASIDSVLDICCGTGAAIETLRPLCRKRVVGIDFSQGMLDVARQRFQSGWAQSGPAVPVGQASPENVDFQVTSDRDGRTTFNAPVELLHGNVLDMTFQEEFDLAVTVGSLGHILPRDESRFIERIAAALVPGGRFAFVTADMPPWWSRRYLLSRAFNAAMHVRNALKRPPFIMFYLTFLLPHAKRLLERHGFDVAIHSGVFTGPLQVLKVVVATKRPHQPEA